MLTLLVSLCAPSRHWNTVLLDLHVAPCSFFSFSNLQSPSYAGQSDGGSWLITRLLCVLMYLIMYLSTLCTASYRMYTYILHTLYIAVHCILQQRCNDPYLPTYLPTAPSHRILNINSQQSTVNSQQLVHHLYFSYQILIAILNREQ